jgi:hypothetical protein
MQRLAKHSFASFSDVAEICAILFGAPFGEATHAQAYDFAAASVGHANIAFGYVDCFEDVSLSRRMAIRTMPTILIIREGVEVKRMEGYHTASYVSRCIRDAESSERSAGPSHSEAALRL